MLATTNFRQAAINLLNPESLGAPQIAARAAGAFQLLARHLARVVGASGVQTVFRRAISLTSAAIPWLEPTEADHTAGHTSLGDEPYFALQAAMSLQPPEAVINAFVTVLDAFVELLGRLIGVPLVARLLDEVWPSTFLHEVKDPP